MKSHKQKLPLFEKLLLPIFSLAFHISHTAHASQIHADCIEKVTRASETVVYPLFQGILPNGAIRLESARPQSLVRYFVYLIDPTKPSTFLSTSDRRTAIVLEPLPSKITNDIFSLPLAKTDTHRAVIVAANLYNIGIQNDPKFFNISMKTQKTFTAEFNIETAVWGQPEICVSCTFKEIEERP